MDFKRIVFSAFTVFAVIIFFSACSDNEKINTENTYYVELVNFKGDSLNLADSLKKNIAQKIYGKASYHENDKLQIVSLNYLTANGSDLHYYKDPAELQSSIKPDTKRIRVEFGGKYTSDSISYSLQKFIYRDNQWKKISDMGFMKATNSYSMTKKFSVDQYGNQIVNSIAVYTYN